jgi:hypothetical protein
MDNKIFIERVSTIKKIIEEIKSEESEMVARSPWALRTGQSYYACLMHLDKGVCSYEHALDDLGIKHESKANSAEVNKDEKTETKEDY